MSALIRLSNWCLTSKMPLGIVLIVTLFFGWHLGKLGINASPYIVDKEHPLRVAHAEQSDLFTNSGEQVMVMLKLGDDLYTPKAIQRISAFSDHLETLSISTESDTGFLLKIGEKYNSDQAVQQILEDGINLYDGDAITRLLQALEDTLTASEKDQLSQVLIRANPVHRVRSMSTVENLIDDDDFLSAEKLIEELPTTQNEAELIKQHTFDNALFHNLLIDSKAHVTNVQVELNITGDDSPNMILAYHGILNVIEEHQFSDQAYLSGVPVVNAEIGHVVDTDNKKFFPFVILVILVILLATFKKLPLVFLTLSVAVLTMVWTMGSMALMGVDQNIVTAILPIFLISIAVADSIHYLSAYLFRLNDSGSDAVKATNTHLMRPMLLTTITTIIGFLALSYSDLVFIKEFGIFVALGVAYAFFITILVLPSFLPRLKSLKATSQPKNHQDQFSKITNRVFQYASKRNFAVLVLAFALCNACIYGALKLKVDNHSTASFNEDARIRADEREITQNLGGIYPVNFWFTSEDSRQFVRPEVINAIETLQNHINQFPQVGYTVSPNDFIKRINKVLAKESHSLPQPLDQSLVAQYLLLYENSSNQDLRDVLDTGYNQARLVALFKSDQASQFEEVITSVRSLAKTTLPDGIELQITGYGAEIVLATELVVHGQITSIVLAILLIGGLMIIYFRSFIIGVIGIVPLSLTILVNFALMSLFKVPLDIGTALISGIAFGIGIDYAIHFISILQKESKNATSINDAITATINDTARPILVNSLSLGLGFLVLALSNFASLRQLGYFVSVSMIACALLTLFILPLIFNKVGPRFLRVQNSNEESVAANLGNSPIS